MIAAAFIAFGHFLAFFALAAALVLELVLIGGIMLCASLMAKGFGV